MAHHFSLPWLLLTCTAVAGVSNDANSCANDRPCKASFTSCIAGTCECLSNFDKTVNSDGTMRCVPRPTPDLSIATSSVNIPVIISSVVAAGVGIILIILFLIKKKQICFNSSDPQVTIVVQPGPEGQPAPLVTLTYPSRQPLQPDQPAPQEGIGNPAWQREK